MNDINPVSNDVLASLSSRNQQAEKETALGKDAFLQLMIAQLQNQDPLNPAKNEDFIAQLAEFSSVEGIQNINETLSELSLAFRSSQALEASSLVGRQVQVDSPVATLSGGKEVRGSIDLAAAAENLQLIIETPQGEVIQRQNLHQQAAGEVAFSWDGRDQSGASVADGAYRVRAVAVVDGSRVDLPVAVGANVNSVTIGQNNALLLNIEGVGPVPLDSVSRFL